MLNSSKEQQNEMIEKKRQPLKKEHQSSCHCRRKKRNDITLFGREKTWQCRQNNIYLEGEVSLARYITVSSQYNTLRLGQPLPT